MEAEAGAAPGVPPPPASSSSSSSSSSWVDKVRAALVLGPEAAGYAGGGSSDHAYYNSKFRKSLQTAVLFEAKRSVDAAQRRLKSYERKYVLLRQAIHLLDALVASGIVKDGPMRDEILWKTATSQQLLDAETAWRRIKAVERELEGLAHQIKPYYYGGSEKDASGVSIVTHDEAVDRMVRAQYDANPTDYVKAYRDVMGTREWELAHNHLLFTFRLYYKGSQLDPDFPPPDDLVFDGATSGNGDGDGRGRRRNGPNASSASSRGRTNHESHSQQHSLPGGDEDERTDDLATGAAGVGAATGTAPSGATAAAASAAVVVDPVADERRNLLREVKDHLDILKEFEGWVPPDELAQRKRALFLALPPAPPPLAATTSAAPNSSSLPQIPAAASTLSASPSRPLRHREPPTSPEQQHPGAKRTRS